MTRINTNVSSLVAQNTLGRSNASLQQALTRLSTGLRINTGKDDPAGLIASENLRSDITSIKQAIGNTDRANQVIATADSALGQVSGLLNDIRGLVTEAANSGALSAEQVAANQLQIDSSLKALNRIAQTVTFQGRKLLDGSLDFITSAGTNFNQLSGLQIDQANLGSAGSVSVNINVTAAATNAQVDITGIASSTAAANATTTFNVTNSASQAAGAVALDTSSASGFTLTGKVGGPAAGAAGNGFTSLVIVDGTTEGTSYDAGTGVLTATVDISNGNDTTADLYAVINAGSDFVATNLSGGTETIADTNTGSGTLVGGRNSGSAAITVTANTAGVNTHTVTLQEVNTGTANTATAALDGSGNIVVSINGTVAKSAIVDAINNDITGYTASAVISGDTNYASSTDSVPGVATLAAGAAASGGLTKAAVFELSGKNGSEVFSFGQNTSITEIVSAINLVKDSTGVKATANGTTLELSSTAYGSDASVEIKLISEASGGTIRAAVGNGARAAGTNVAATVNGITATGSGNSLSVNTSSLDLKTSVLAGFTGSVAFNITGGGALFQLGPDVVTNQQARIGITSVNTARLGGASGVLYQLASGGTASLSSDPTAAATIVDEAITQVTSLRGRLGAFQRTSLETNKNTLNDTLVNLTQAESNIRDADFAAETAALTRAQILVQSGTTVLQVANQNPQNVLALLR